MRPSWAGTLALAAAVSALPSAARAQDKATVQQGAALFTSQKCGMCHAVEGKGNAKGKLDGVGARLSEADIRAWLTDPEAMRLTTKAARTPAMKKHQLNGGQVDALVAYLASLK